MTAPETAILPRERRLADSNTCVVGDARRIAEAVSRCRISDVLRCSRRSAERRDTELCRW